jgi:hypothetical protein
MIASTQPSCHNQLKSLNSFSVSLLGLGVRLTCPRYVRRWFIDRLSRKLFLINYFVLDNIRIICDKSIAERFYLSKRRGNYTLLLTKAGFAAAMRKPDGNGVEIGPFSFHRRQECLGRLIRTSTLRKRYSSPNPKDGGMCTPTGTHGGNYIAPVASEEPA